jgi:hypothetical protein
VVLSRIDAPRRAASEKLPEADLGDCQLSGVESTIARGFSAAKAL